MSLPQKKINNQKENSLVQFKISQPKKETDFADPSGELGELGDSAVDAN